MEQPPRQSLSLADSLLLLSRLYKSSLITIQERSQLKDRALQNEAQIMGVFEAYAASRDQEDLVDSLHRLGSSASDTESQTPGNRVAALLAGVGRQTAAIPAKTSLIPSSDTLSSNPAAAPPFRSSRSHSSPGVPVDEEEIDRFRKQWLSFYEFVKAARQSGVRTFPLFGITALLSVIPTWDQMI